MIGFLNRLLTRRYALVSIKLSILLIFFTLIWIGFKGRVDHPGSMEHIRNTNLGSLVIWNLWWPMIIVLAVFLGRIWCMVCPVELITTLFSRIGFRKSRPKWFFTGWGITIFYILILVIGIEGFHIHHNPIAMSVYLVSIMAAALFIGLIYEKNTFCRSFCPVGNLLALYSRLSFLGWRVKNHEKCDHCSDKSCVQKDRIYAFTNKSCGVDLYPAHIDSNSDCILCGGCRQSCAHENPSKVNGRPNPGLTFIGFASDLFRLKPLRMAEAVFIFVVTGFVINEVLSEWTQTGFMASLAPERIMGEGIHHHEVLCNILGFGLICIIVPTILWFPSYLGARMLGLDLSLKKYFFHYSVAFIPLVAFTEVSNALLESISHYIYYPQAIHDFSGVQTARLMSLGEILIHPVPHWLFFSMSLLVVGLLLVGFYYCIRVIYQTNQLLFGNDKRGYIFLLIPLLFGLITVLSILGV